MITLLCVCLLPIAGHANNEGACKRYATEAVRQNSQNMALQAGFGGPAWSSDYNAHYNWCVHGNNAQSTPRHMADRARQLQELAIKRMDSKSAAKRYAEEAVRQYKASQAMKTGFAPPVWSGDFSAHYNWILHGRNIDASPRHLADREAKLQQHAVEHGYQPAGSGMVVATPIAAQPAVNGGAGATSGSTASTTPMIMGQVTGIAKIDKDKPVNPPAIKMGNIAGGGLNAVSSLRNARALIESRINRSGFNPLTPAENPIFDIPAGKPNQTVHIGRGYNSLLKQPAFTAVDIPQSSLQVLNVNKMHAESGYVRNMEEYYAHLGVDVKASGSYMGFSGSNSTQFEKNTQNNKYNERFVSFVRIETALESTRLDDLKLNQKATKVLREQGVDEFYRQYGDCFVYAVQYGAELKGVGAYQLLEDEEEIKFTTETNASGDWVVGGFDVNVKVDKTMRSRKEHESRKIVFDAFGVPTLKPASIDELEAVSKTFAQKAGQLAQQSTYANKNGGILYYTVMKYSELPDFQQIAGVNSLNMKEQRELMDQLAYYKRRISYMLANLNYIVDGNNLGKFKPADRQKASASITKLKPYLQSVNNDIALLQQYPLDRSKWKFNPNNYNYARIPDVAPDTRFVKVKIHFPAEYKDPSAATSPTHDWTREHVGPLLGQYSHIRGDDDTHGDKIDINLHTKLGIEPDGKEAFVRVEFLEKENRHDYTTFQGFQQLPIYKAPENHVIVGFRKASEDYYLRNLRRNAAYAKGPTLQNVNATLDWMKDKSILKNYPVKDPIWRNLSVIFDTEGGDYEVGVFGDLEVEVELKALNPQS